MEIDPMLEYSHQAPLYLDNIYLKTNEQIIMANQNHRSQCYC